MANPAINLGDVFDIFHVYRQLEGEPKFKVIYPDEREYNFSLRPDRVFTPYIVTDVANNLVVAVPYEDKQVRRDKFLVQIPTEKLTHFRVDANNEAALREQPKLPVGVAKIALVPQSLPHPQLPR